jgi:hypothetical protein
VRAINYSDVMFNAMQLCGLDRDDINNQTFRQIRDLISMRLRTAWEYDKWPELLTIEPKAVVTHTDGMQYFEITEDSMYDVLAVYDYNPLSTTKANEVSYFITNWESNGVTKNIVVIDNVPETVYVERRYPCPVLNGESWDSTTAYTVGAQCYFDVGSQSGGYKTQKGTVYGGNFWVCTTPNSNQKPSETSQFWKRIVIPHTFSNYLARAVLADYLRSESQFENAKIAEQEADAFLELEVDKVARQQNQNRPIRFFNPY